VAGGSLFSVAIKKDGSLWLWGVNTYGQLGDNSITTRSTPTELIYPSCSKDWAKVSAGKNHVAAIKKDGTLWAWGLNSSGQLGQSDTTDRSTPTQIGTGSLAATWFRVSAGSAHTAAIKDAGIDF
jgi:alpha-tubulin suppressor-like RCC1 family protein